MIFICILFRRYETRRVPLLIFILLFRFGKLMKSCCFCAWMKFVNQFIFFILFLNIFSSLCPDLIYRNDGLGGKSRNSLSTFLHLVNVHTNFQTSIFFFALWVWISISRNSLTGIIIFLKNFPHLLEYSIVYYTDTWRAL